MKAKQQMAKMTDKQGQSVFQVKLVGEGHPVWGMTSAERLKRMFARIGPADISAWDDTGATAETCFVVSADHVFSQVLLSDLTKQEGTVLTSNGKPVAAYVPADRAADIAADIASGQLDKAADLTTSEPENLSSGYDLSLRKNEVPFVMALSAETVPAIEQQTFKGSYKGVTDFVTLYCWPKPAIAVVRWCAKAGISPNMVTSASLVLVFVTMWLFWNGYFMTGIIVGWLMTFLDTVDGKLARVTITSTKFGNVFDHGIDLIHPPFWYWAWAVGVAATVPDAPSLTFMLWVIVVGYVVQRLQEGYYIRKFGIHIHVWRKFDSVYRLYVARRNPNMFLLMVFTMFGYPAEGLIAVGLWTAVSLVVHSIQIAQALRAPMPLRSWLDH